MSQPWTLFHTHADLSVGRHDSKHKIIAISLIQLFHHVGSKVGIVFISILPSHNLGSKLETTVWDLDTEYCSQIFY